MSNTNRRKGHNLERLVARLFKEMGYPFAKTSRAVSRVLDNCKVDIAHIPYNIQCKAGYPRSRPKYEKIFQEIKEELAKNFPEDDIVHNLPIILLHKLDGRKEENFHWITSFEFGMELLREIKEYHDRKDQTELLLGDIKLTKEELIHKLNEIWK